MKTYYPIVFFMLLLSYGCDRVVFNEPQPVNGRILGSIPKMYQGVYESTNLHLELKKESIVVNGLSFVLSKELPQEGTIQLRFYDNFYFINVGDSLAYSVFMAQFIDDKLAVYMLNPDARSLERIKRIAAVETKQQIEQSLHRVTVPKNGFFKLVDQEVFDVLGVLHFKGE